MNVNSLLYTEHAIEPSVLTANFQPALVTEENSECLVSIFTCWLLLFPGWGFSMGTKYHFHSWRVFVLVCALPCIASLVALKFMPESPRFLLEVRWFISNVAAWYQQRMAGPQCVTVCLSLSHQTHRTHAQRQSHSYMSTPAPQTA